MRLKPNDKVTRIVLPSLDGSVFDLDCILGKRYLLSFLRFASCPFCNLRVHELVKRFPEFGNNFTIVAVFDSTLENLQKHAGRHAAPFPILADGDNIYRKAYSIEHSVTGMFKGLLFRIPALLRAILVHKFLPFRIKGSLTAMPADFLVNESGIIQAVHYGSDEGDHMAFDLIKNYSLTGMLNKPSKPAMQHMDFQAKH
jgi:peroxiredoxin